ncbi:MAG: carbon-nitrogen family hydrolase [Candidatus Syntrophonatronum acetioxidans]|uniref:Carbon-nitrogen family hydrolase n=1 Tax=Candidatus Syntrophonatronum acetioxidans TaxID=1795816 RepID=A0A424YIQ4_9FIRM|nr:MAG: carbon-nitrogen family hydrolase [Candidatus Syntrophonatronum acetioxidans]
MIAVILQADIKKGDPQYNQQHLLEMMTESLKERPDLIILPEMWNTGYPENIKELACNKGEPVVSLVSSFARDNQVNVVAGSISDGEGDKLYNRSYVFSRRGEIVAVYDKIHLFKLMEEDKNFVPGRGKALFSLDNITCGLLICYDLRFPELSRSLVKAGAQVLIIVAHWPRSRMEAWRFLVGARAAENQVFAIGVNRGGREGDMVFGNSLVVDPGGKVLGEGGEEETSFTVEIDRDQVVQARQEIFYLEDRKPEIY